MIAIGRYNTLPHLERTSAGLWLGTEDDRVLLPAAQIPDEAPDPLKVFVYTEGDGTPVATTTEPLALVGEFALLEVVAVSSHGSWLDWGLPKDLLLPGHEQYDELRVGDKVVVKVILDRQDRVMAVNQLTYHFDKRVDRLKEGQAVEALVYSVFERGFRVVVDGRFSGVLFKDETHRPLSIGDTVRAYIAKVRDDGRLNLSLRPLGRSAADDARSVLIAAIKEADGFLPLTDKSSPTAIRHRLHLSKKQFKRAAGGLYKERKIAIEDKGLRWLDDE